MDDYRAYILTTITTGLNEYHRREIEWAMHKVRCLEQAMVNRLKRAEEIIKAIDDESLAQLKALADGGYGPYGLEFSLVRAFHEYKDSSKMSFTDVASCFLTADEWPEDRNDEPVLPVPSCTPEAIEFIEEHLDSLYPDPKEDRGIMGYLLDCYHFGSKKAKELRKRLSLPALFG